MSHTQTPFGGAAYAERNCVGLNPELFFPGERDPPDVAQQAKNVCQGCVVKDECLEYALVNVIREGVWGGESERSRRRLRAARRLIS